MTELQRNPNPSQSAVISAIVAWLESATVDEVIASTGESWEERLATLTAIGPMAEPAVPAMDGFWQRMRVIPPEHRDDPDEDTLDDPDF